MYALTFSNKYTLAPYLELLLKHVLFNAFIYFADVTLRPVKGKRRSS
jgi:hypothetical protein